MCVCGGGGGGSSLRMVHKCVKIITRGKGETAQRPA